MSTNATATAAAAAAAAAQAAALRAFNTELWTLYAFGVLFTVVRTIARIRTVGVTGLAPDDFLIWVAILFYTAQSTLAFFDVNTYGGIANNSMTDAERAALSPTSAEYNDRVMGSKIQVAGWTTYICLIFVLRLCMLFFYRRLTEGLTGSIRIRNPIGFGLAGVTLVTSIITMYSACRPFNNYFQINPNPGNSCQAAISLPIVWVTFTSSIIMDIYLIMIPLPMLWSTRLATVKKIASSVILGAGIFVLVCSLLKTVFAMTDQVNGAQEAGSWGTREVFVSVSITNLPMVFHLMRQLLQPLFGSILGSTANTKYNNNYGGGGSTGFRTIGGGTSEGGAGFSRNRHTVNRDTDAEMFDNDSEEHIVRGIRMDNLQESQTYATGPQGLKNGKESVPAKGIVLTSEFQVTTDQDSVKYEA
ncbi:hypothetical protein SCUCBS95973_001541 [Sporothrix curviconia]|uniref:Rhodopsin domain-containing protein n=1 Tax=Sporothrix curviconia TaxID=1260050 RepID=A0ABP0AZF5_9PEZI